MRTTKADPIIAEVRAIRDKHAARFDYDIDAIFRDIRAAQEMYFINSKRPTNQRRVPTEPEFDGGDSPQVTSCRVFTDSTPQHRESHG